MVWVFSHWLRNVQVLTWVCFLIVLLRYFAWVTFVKFAFSWVDTLIVDCFGFVNFVIFELLDSGIWGFVGFPEFPGFMVFCCLHLWFCS